jgi:hypothetical protein
MYRTCLVSYVKMLRVTGYYVYDTVVRVYITSNCCALNTHTHTNSLSHTHTSPSQKPEHRSVSEEQTTGAEEALQLFVCSAL